MIGAIVAAVAAGALFMLMRKPTRPKPASSKEPEEEKTPEKAEGKEEPSPEKKERSIT